MIARVRRLEPDDNAPLLALARVCTTGSDAFRVERGPDFFALGQKLGAARYFGAWDDEDALIATLGVTRQRRFLAGRDCAVDYVHDLRVHPRARCQGVASTLLEHAARSLSGELTWCFASILGDNPQGGLLARGFVSGFERVRPLGSTLHVGVPLFAGGWPRGCEVVEIDRLTFCTHYVRWARGCDFAPSEQHLDGARGPYLGIAERGRIVAVYKLVDESRERRFLATRSLGLAARGVDFFLRRRACAGLPRRGEELRLCYAGFYAACDGELRLAAMRAHARETRAHTASYLFLGLAADALRRTPLPLGSVHFGSLHWAFGAVPEAVRMDFHELTLM